MRWDGKIRMLGPARVTTPAGRTVEFARARRQRQLLAYLVLHRHAANGITAIAEAIWPNEALTHEAAKNRITGLILTLRGRIEDINRSAIRSFDGPLYKLDVAPEAIDTECFARAAHTALSAGLENPLHVLKLTDMALAVWGEPYEGVKDESFARDAIENLGLLHTQVRRVRAEALLETGRPHEALTQIKAIPGLRDERLVALRMRALFGSGRTLEALEHLREFREAYMEIGLLLPDSLLKLEEAILNNELEVATPSRGKVDLGRPSLSPGVLGRDADIATVDRLLQHHSIVTVCGVGGLGKTTVVRELYRLWPGREADRHFVSIASSSASVPHTLASVLGIRNEPGVPVLDQIIDKLAKAAALVVLDNCEVSLAEARSVAGEIFRHAPSVKVLTSSRQPLGVEGEFVFTLPPLDDLTRSDIRSTASLQLIEQWAHESLAHLDDATVAGLVTRTGGLPILCQAIGGLLRTTPAESILDHTPGHFDRLGVATGSLQQSSVSEILGWTLDRLSREALATLKRCSMFSGSFTIEDVARAYTMDREGFETDMRELLQLALVRKTAGRFEVPVPVRETVRSTVESETLRHLSKAHAEHHIESSRIGKRLLKDAPAIHQIDERLEEFRSAMAWLLAQDRPLAAGRIASNLDQFFLWSGRSDEGRSWLERAIVELSEPNDASELVYTAQVNKSGGFLASVDGDYRMARSLLELSIDQYTLALRDLQLGEKLWIAAAGGRAWADFHLGRSITSEVFCGLGEDTQLKSAGYFERGLAAARAGGRGDIEAWMLPFAAWNRVVLDAEPNALIRRAIDQTESLGLQEPMGIAYVIRGLENLKCKRLVEASEDVGQGLDALRETSNRYSLQITYAVAAALAFVNRREIDERISTALDSMIEQPSREFDGMTLGIACAELARRRDGVARPIARWLDKRYPGWVAMWERFHIPGIAELSRTAQGLASKDTMPQSARKAAAMAKERITA